MGVLALQAKGESIKSVSSIKTVLKEFSTYFETNLQEPQISPDIEAREDRLRVSGFPYCGLRHIHARLKGNYEERIQFGMKYYTSVGTETHKYVQYFLGFGSKMLGKWKCLNPNCSGTHKIRTSNKCPKCEGPMDYKELEVRAERHLSGHLDGIYKAKNGKYYLIDYKTSSVKALTSNYKSKYLPYKTNVAQIKAYCALIELEHKITISGWILVYLARDKPMAVHLTTGAEISAKEKRSIIKKIKNYDKQYHHVMFAKKFSHIKSLIQIKSCATREFYDLEFKSAFNPCPLSENNLCFKPNKLESYMKELWDDKKEGWNEHRRPTYLNALTEKQKEIEDAT